jgi:hypothetical protein
MLLPRERVVALDPAKIEAYLAAHGWKRDAGLSSSEAGVYQLAADPQAEILVPRNKEVVDYALRVGEALQAMAVAQRRTAWDVLEQLSDRQADVRPNGRTAGKRQPAPGAARVWGKKKAP